MPRMKRDRKLYEQLVRQYGGDVYRFAYRLSGDKDLADDLTQEAFCEAWRSLGDLRNPERGKSWLMQILRHRFLHTVRDSGRRVQARPDMEALNQLDTGDVASVLARLADQELLQHALDLLEDRFKEPFLLVFLEGFHCREVAELLDLPLGTVLSRIHRARIQMRASIRQLDPVGDHQRDWKRVSHESKTGS